MTTRSVHASIAALIVGIGSLTPTAESRAANFCVNTSNALRQALVTAASNGESDTVRIEAGTYTGLGGNLAFPYNTVQNFALNVSGGWVSVGSQPCIQQILQPGNTVLTGSNTSQVLNINGGNGSGQQTLSNLTLRNGFTSQSGAGLSIGGAGGFDGRVLVTRVLFDRNESTSFAGGMSIFTQGIATVLNNVFLLNRCGQQFCGLSATVNAESATTLRASFGNNTFVGNGCPPGPCSAETGGARFGGTASAIFYNNLFALNSGADIALNSPNIELRNNNYVSIVGTPLMQSGNINFANPQFIDLLDDDLRLLVGSPLRNAGTNVYTLLGQDFSGLPRINDLVVDIGAYEIQEAVFADQFELVNVE